MTEKEKRTITENRKITLDFWAYWDQLVPLFFIVFIPFCLGLYVLTLTMIKGQPNKFGIYATLIFSPILILAIRKIISNKKVEIIGKEISIDQLKKAIKKTNWTIQYFDENQIIASTRISLFSWGETIRIFLFDGTVYFNSIGKAPITFGRNKKNKNILIEKLKTTPNNE